jgi:hypothetical protein
MVADTFTILSNLLSEAPLDIQIIISEVLKNKYNIINICGFDITS